MDPNNSEYYDSTQEKTFFESFGAHFIDFMQTLVVIGAIFVLIYLFIAQPHKVSGNSMVPTFHNSDYILTDKLSYQLGLPKYGDIVVFKNPRDESQDFIKRIIGTPGDTVMLQNNVFYVNGTALEEKYLPINTVTRGGRFLSEGNSKTIEENHYFVVGDNREHSSDSREWGTIAKQEIIGKVFFRYWPPNAFGLIKHLPSN